MKNLVNKIGRWLFIKTGGDIVEATRLAYRLLVPAAFAVRKDDGSADYMAFLEGMAALKDNKFLGELLALISEGQRDLVIESARTPDDINLARGTLNAAALIKKILESYAVDCDKRKKGSEEFNKYSVV